MMTKSTLIRKPKLEVSSDCYLVGSLEKSDLHSRMFVGFTYGHATCVLCMTTWF